jgi:aryl-alcohol dehydrogenase-like predicted oxidoreductase
MKRTLGRSNIEISALGMGCWAIGGEFWSGAQPLGWGKVDDLESTRAIHAALELGVNFFDTADVYGAGHSERVLGRALKGKRDQVVIATKFGNLFDETTKQTSGTTDEPNGIRQACEASLRRLETDYIDLYQFHVNHADPNQAPRVRDTLEELVIEGKIRSYAWSTDDPARAEIFAQGEHCTAVQHQLNVLEDNPEMLQLCERLDLASINRGPLAMGLLTGKFSSTVALETSDIRRVSPDWMQYFKDGVPNPAWLAKLEAIREILTSERRTLAQGALAWLWGRSPKTIPIPGFRTVAQVQENAGALEFGPLEPAQMQEIEVILGTSVQ